MPEGDTIERIAQRLQPLVGTVPEIATPLPRHALRIPERLAGQALVDVEARGKHLLLSFANGLVLHVHLRMTGRFRVAPATRPLRVAEHRIWLELRGAGVRAVLLDGPVLELLTPAQLSLHPSLRRLGGDVLDDDFDPAAAARRLRTRDPRPPSAARCSTSAPWRASATSGAPRSCTPWASGPRGSCGRSTTPRWSGSRPRPGR